MYDARIHRFQYKLGRQRQMIGNIHIMDLSITHLQIIVQNMIDLIALNGNIIFESRMHTRIQRHKITISCQRQD